MTATLHLVALAACLLPASVLAQDEVAARPASAGGQWRPLFNGKDLTGWTPKIVGHAAGVNFGDTFRVEDGVLKVGYAAYENFDGRFGHLFYDTPFSDYRLRVQYRFVGEQAPGGPGWAFRNSGLMLHGQSPRTMDKDQDFPCSIEVQLLGGRETGKRTTANVCTPGTHIVLDGKLHKRHCTDSTSETYRGDGWVTVEVEVRGDRIKHVVGGKTVLEYTEPQLDPGDGKAKKLLDAGHPAQLRRGTISLQSESHPVEFRRVEIMELGDWLEPLAGGDLSKHWTTTGNWKLDDQGVVTLQPREGESGWRRFGAYLWLTGDYRDFECEFDYRVQARGNSGFYFHVGDVKSPVQKGIEVQIYDSGDKKAGARLTDHDSGGVIPGIPPKVNAARPAGEWNRFNVTCRGRTVRIELNGEVVNVVSLDHPRLQVRPATGAIGFQDHGLPLALRRIRVRRL